MHATRTALFAAIGLSLGFGQQAFSAPLSGARTLTAPAVVCPSDSADGDIQFPSQAAEAREVLAAHAAPAGSEPEVLPNVAPDADVATDLANDLNNNYGVMGERTNGPTCCAPACCTLCPSWTFSVGTIFLNQNRPGHSAILDTSVGNRLVAGPPLLSANQFNPGVRFGYELDAIRHNVGGSCWDVEARYFGINRWNSTVPAFTTPALGAAFPFAPTAIQTAGLGTPIGALYQSLLQNVELNARRSINPWLQLIVGLRYLAYDDSVSTMTTPLIGTAQYSSINARNNMVGAQIGANAFLWQRGRAGVQAFGKGGVYGNVATNNTSINNGIFTSSARVGHTSFVGEFGLTGTYRLTKNWGLRTTYEMLWVDGVARAPDQIAASNPIIGAGSVNPYGSVFYYGGFVGLEYYR
jgi:hypothetical protein